jgi:hypothetical protein
MIRRLGRVVRGLALGLAAMAAAGGAGAAFCAERGVALYLCNTL